MKSKEVESAELVWPVLGTEALIRIGSNMLPSLLGELYYVLYHSTVYIMMWNFQSIMAGRDGIFCAW